MNGTFILRIDFGDGGVETPQDLAQVLREMAAKVESKDICEEGSGKLLDDNGNHIGDWEIEGDSDDDEDA